MFSFIKTKQCPCKKQQAIKTCADCSISYCNDCLKPCASCKLRSHQNTKSKVICNNCGITCSKCSEVICKGCQNNICKCAQFQCLNCFQEKLFKCGVCGLSICKQCSVLCPNCSKAICTDCQRVCKCSKIVGCKNCASLENLCKSCKKITCADHIKKCEMNCGTMQCTLKCMVECFRCKKKICLKCSKSCSCLLTLCPNHVYICKQFSKSCRKRVCDICAMVCKKCNDKFCEYDVVKCSKCKTKNTCITCSPQCSNCYLKLCPCAGPCKSCGINYFCTENWGQQLSCGFQCEACNNKCCRSCKTPSSKECKKCFQKKECRWNERETNGDFVIKIGDSKLNVHSDVLKQASPVFEAMLRLEMKEKLEGELVIDTGSKEAVTVLLNYIYFNGSISNSPNDAHVWFEVYQLAKMYEIKNLPQLAVSEICKLINKQNVLDILAMSFSEGVDEVLEKCFEVMNISQDSRWIILLMLRSNLDLQKRVKYLEEKFEKYIKKR